MTLQNQLIEICDETGPNIPQRTVAIYCGIPVSQLNKFMKTGTGMSEERQEQVARGLRELAREISQIVNS